MSTHKHIAFAFSFAAILRRNPTKRRRGRRIVEMELSKLKNHPREKHQRRSLKMRSPACCQEKIQLHGRTDSNLKTKKNASGKRPPDEAHGPGDETIRPQRSSEAERNSEKNVPNARATLTMRVGAALSQKIYACAARHVPRWCK